jgi:hypothetical protein
MKKITTPLPPLSVLERLAKAKTSKKRRSIIKEAWDSDSEEFFIGLELSSDPTLDFGITSAPLIEDIDDGSEGSYTFRQFYDLCQRLAHEALSSSERKNLIYDAAERANISAWNLWYRKILLKKLHQELPMLDIIEELKLLTNACNMLNSSSNKEQPDDDGKS